MIMSQSKDLMEGPEEGEIYDSLEDISSDEEQENTLEVTSKTNKIKKINYFTTKKKSRKIKKYDEEEKKPLKKALLNKTSLDNLPKEQETTRRHKRKYSPSSCSRSRSSSRSISLSPEHHRCTCHHSPSSFSSLSPSPNYRTRSKRVNSSKRRCRSRSRSPYRQRLPISRPSRSPPIRHPKPRSPKYRKSPRRKISRDKSPERFTRSHRSESPAGKLIFNPSRKHRKDKERRKLISKKLCNSNDDQDSKNSLNVNSNTVEIIKDDSTNNGTPKLKKKLLNAGFIKENSRRDVEIEKFEEIKSPEVEFEEDLENLRLKALNSQKIVSPLISISPIPFEKSILSKTPSPTHDSPIPLSKSPLHLLNSAINDPKEKSDTDVLPEELEQIEETNSENITKLKEGKKIEKQKSEEMLEEPYDPSEEIEDNEDNVPFSIMNEDEDVLELRMAALKSAVLFKHEKRKQKKNENNSHESESKKGLNKLPSPDHTIVDMDIASDEGEGRIEDGPGYYYSNMDFIRTDTSAESSFGNLSLHQLLPALPMVDPSSLAQTTAAFVEELRSRAKRDPNNINVLQALNIEIPENSGYPIPIIQTTPHHSPELIQTKSFKSRPKINVKKSSNYLRPNLIQVVNNTVGNSSKPASIDAYNPEEEEELLRAALLQSLEKNNNSKKTTASSLSPFSAASPTSEGPYSPSGDVVMPIHSPPSTPSSTSLQIPTPIVDSPLVFSTIQPQQSFLPKRNYSIPLTNPLPYLSEIHNPNLLIPEIHNSNLLNPQILQDPLLPPLPITNNALSFTNHANPILQPITSSNTQLVSENHFEKNKQKTFTKGTNLQKNISNLKVTCKQKNNSNVDRFVICLNTDSESDDEENKTKEVNTDFEKSVESFLKKAREDVEAKTLKTGLINIQQMNKPSDEKAKLINTREQNNKNILSIHETIKLPPSSSTLKIQMQKTSINSKLPIQALNTVENKTKTLRKSTTWNNSLINNKKFVAKAIHSGKLGKPTPIKLPKINLQASMVKTTPLSVKLLHPTKQHEYRQLKAKILAVETQKLAKLTAEKKAATLAASPKALRFQLSKEKFRKENTSTITSQDANKNSATTKPTLEKGMGSALSSSVISNLAIKPIVPEVFLQTNIFQSDKEENNLINISNISSVEKQNDIIDLPLKISHNDKIPKSSKVYEDLISPNIDISEKLENLGDKNTNSTLPVEEDEVKESSLNEINKSIGNESVTSSNNSENINSNSITETRESNSSLSMNVSPVESSSNLASRIILQAKKKLFCLKNKEKEELEIISKENKENIEEDEDSSEELSKAERDLLINRTKVIEHLTLLNQQILDLENKQRREKDLALLVTNLTLKLRDAESRLTKQKNLNNSAKVKLANSRRVVTQERSKCVTLTKKCLTIGINVKGRDYKVPCEGADLIMKKTEEVSNYTKRLRGAKALSQSAKKNSNSQSKQLKNSTDIIKNIENCNTFSEKISEANNNLDQGSSLPSLNSDTNSETPGPETNTDRTPSKSPPPPPTKLCIDQETSSSSNLSILQPEEKNVSIIKFEPYKSPLEYLQTHRIADPHAFLCPYQLSGRCIDDACGYQHCDSS